MTNQELQQLINESAYVVGKTWPLYSFVTANPLSGYENLPFFDAVTQAGERLNADLLPEPDVFRKAWKDNKIANAQICRLLSQAGFDREPEYYLEQMIKPVTETYNVYHELDRLTVKWLSLFLDEGMAAWSMPFKEMGFYTAWRKLIVYDDDIRKKIRGKIPKTPEEALSVVFEDLTVSQQHETIEQHLAALPGWVGFIKYRVENNSIWNKEYPVDLIDFLAVRLWMARCLKVPMIGDVSNRKDLTLLKLKFIWLEAWEQTWQENFFSKIKVGSKEPLKTGIERPAAQLVFCLDTRSELLRRSLEQTGNYETFGSAGAFGLTMDYRNPESGLVNKSSPAMVPSKYLVFEQAKTNHEGAVQDYFQSSRNIHAYQYFLKRMKNILPSAFGFVEGSGLYYGVFMLLRIFCPALANRLMLKHRKGYEDIFEPHIRPVDQIDDIAEITVSEKADIVWAAFDSCGWRTFSPLVVFTGHASRSANNPFASSLDCGACAGHPGKRNARTLARLANTKEVKQILAEKYAIAIPDDTVFIAAEHITSTDDVVLFDQEVPESHRTILEQLKQDLAIVREKVTKERLGEQRGAPGIARIKSTSWSESRPEWGLSGHAGYIIGPRALTMNGRFNDCFMSSYDWRTDQDGSVLKGIMQGPLVVVQWINDHYYFSTVANDVLGGGSKITHNITGKYGVVQGNGSDLKMGLPLQSVMINDHHDLFHDPIRITTLIQAPERIVKAILADDRDLKRLLDNEWLHLFIMDPERNNDIRKYK